MLVNNGMDYEYGVPFKADVVRCCVCGLAWQEPRPTIKDLPDYYPPEYNNYSKPRGLLLRTLFHLYEKQSVDEVVKLIGRTGHILDVGCGSGLYLDTLKPHGDWERMGQFPEFTKNYSGCLSATDHGFIEKYLTHASAQNAYPIRLDDNYRPISKDGDGIGNVYVKD